MRLAIVVTSLIVFTVALAGCDGGTGSGKVGIEGVREDFVDQGFSCESIKKLKGDGLAAVRCEKTKNVFVEAILFKETQAARKFAMSFITFVRPEQRAIAPFSLRGRGLVLMMRTEKPVTAGEKETFDWVVTETLRRNLDQRISVIPAPGA